MKKNLNFKNNAFVVIGANSKIFKLFINKYKYEKYDYFLYSKKNPNLKFNYRFSKWQLWEQIDITNLRNYKNITILIFAHDWQNYYTNYHIKGFKKLNLELEKKLFHKKNLKKIYFSSFSANRNASNFYGKIKYAIERIFLKHNFKIVRISLIVDSTKFYHFKKIINNSKKKIVILPKSSEKFQLVNINILIKKINLIVNKKLKTNVFNIGTIESFSLKELIQFYSKNKSQIFIEINLNIVLITLKILCFLKLFNYRIYDSLLGLKKQFYLKKTF